jgi:hypothetical protein
VSFLGCNAMDGRLPLIIMSERSLPPSRLLFSFSNYSRCLIVARGLPVFLLVSTSALLYVATLNFLLVLYPLYFTVAPALSFLFPFFPSRWVEKRTAEDYYRIVEENGWESGADKEEDSV